MPSVEELLSQTSDDETNLETYADTGIEYCTVDDDTRLVTIPDEYKKLGVESDEKVKRIWFRFPKLVGNNGVDLSAIGVRVNYRNANGDGDIYIVEDLTTDGDYVTFSWELTRKVTAYKGNVSFVVCAVKSATDGTIKNEWNTTLNKECEVLEGLEVTEQITQENPDIIEYILANLGGSGITVAFKNALLDAIAHVAWTDENGQSYYDALATALEGGGDEGGTTVVTLTSISATYGGGEVASGTALSDLTDIVVTGIYSDGSTKTITNYTLSGEIVEGTNTITVSYGGLTTTFEVVGTASTRTYLEIDATATNLHNATAYRDDGETSATIGGGAGYGYVLNQTFDEDIDIHFKITWGETTLWRNLYLASAVPTTLNDSKIYTDIATIYRLTSIKNYYVEGDGTDYTYAGNVYEGVYTLKAGCVLVIGNLSNTTVQYDTENTYFYVEG